MFICWPGTLAMHRTWELHTKKLSRMFPGWLASITTALVVAWVLVQIQTSDDISSCCRNSFCWSCKQKKALNVRYCSYVRSLKLCHCCYCHLIVGRAQRERMPFHNLYFALSHSCQWSLKKRRGLRHLCCACCTTLCWRFIPRPIHTRISKELHTFTSWYCLLALSGKCKANKYLQH